MRTKQQLHYLTDNLKIVMHQNRGGVPYYNLYTKEKFLFWKYWSLWTWSTNLDTLGEYVKRWEEWENE